MESNDVWLGAENGSISIFFWGEIHVTLYNLTVYPRAIYLSTQILVVLRACLLFSLTINLTLIQSHHVPIDELIIRSS